MKVHFEVTQVHWGIIQTKKNHKINKQYHTKVLLLILSTKAMLEPHYLLQVCRTLYRYLFENFDANRSYGRSKWKQGQLFSRCWSSKLYSLEIKRHCEGNVPQHHGALNPYVIFSSSSSHSLKSTLLILGLRKNRKSAMQSSVFYGNYVCNCELLSLYNNQ